MKIYWATRLRGFLKHISNNLDKFEFENKNGYYEVRNVKSKILNKIKKMKIFDYLGWFSIPKVKNIDSDVYGSFNRFLDTDKPYFIYLENPTALYNYCLDRIKYPLGKNKFRKYLNNPNLKGIICMSNSCNESFIKVNKILPSNFINKTIYPYVPENIKVDREFIIKKSMNQKIEVLFSVQGIRFISKGGLEVIEIANKLRSEDLHFTIITKIDEIDKDIIDKINKANITLVDFSLTYEQLLVYYEKTNILLHPTSDDSFGLTILEAMKNGCTVISTNMYAINEMITDGENGYLVDPKYRFFNLDNTPNRNVWNNRKRTIYKKEISNELVEKVVKKMNYLINDRNLLKSMSLKSYEKAINPPFSSSYILKQWSIFLNQMEVTDER